MKEDLLKTKAMSLDIALGISAAVGVTAGVILSLNMDAAMLISLCGAEQKLALAAQGEWFQVFLSSFIGVGAMLLAAFFLGFCALSQPVELLLVAFRGLGLGVCVRGVYLSANVMSSMAAFLPYAILSTGVLVLALKESFGLSMHYLRMSTTTENRLGIKNEIRDYTAKFMIYAMLLAALAMADAFLARSIGNI